MTLQLDVVVTRGDRVESRHRVHAAVVDATDTLVASAGEPAYECYWRSCAKPFQLLPFVRAGGLERFEWGDEEIALACGSHGGEPEHVAVAARMLASIGREEGDLACGIHEPMSGRGMRMARDAGAPLSRLHNNCSGKHAAMLGRAVLAGLPTAGYERRDHAVQREIFDEVVAWTGEAAEDIGVAVDGCGVPVFALRLDAMARAYARFAAAIATGDDGAAARIGNAMKAEPFLVGGTERFDTVLAEESAGAVISKVGAEGVHCVAVPGARLGLAIKVEDGALRAQQPATLAALVQLGVLPEPLPERLTSFLRRAVRNTRGELVGEVRPAGPGER